MIKVIKPPQIYVASPLDKTLFLGGSIEMGAAPRWQDEFVKLASHFLVNGEWVIYNPRRDDWDTSLKQEATDPQFFQQVEWEMTHLEKVKYRLFYFAENTISPITLLELGKYSERRSHVVCDAGYARKGNVEMFCYKYDIPMYTGFLPFIHELNRYARPQNWKNTWTSL